MAGPILAAIFVFFFFGLTFVAWRRYLWVAEKAPDGQVDTSPYGLTEVFGDRHLVKIPHQEGVQWLVSGSKYNYFFPRASLIINLQQGVQSLVAKYESRHWLQGGSPVVCGQEGV